MSNNIPVDIEFLIKNVNFEEEAAKIKKGIADVGITTDKVAGKMETDLVGSLNKASVAADNMNAKFKSSAAGINQLAQGNSRLNYSIQQVARELPTLALSPQMFILAISNNLPILQDQLRRTRLENEALKASGQQTTSIFKQVAGSLMSWQTALVLGITVLTIYGKEIFNWIGGLFKASSAIKLTREQIKGLNSDLAKNMGSEMGTVNMLFSGLEKVKEGSAKYYDIRRKIIEQYGGYLTGLDSEITSLRNVEGAYRAITTAIIEQSREKALNSFREKESAEATKTTIEQYEIIQGLFAKRFGEGIGGFKFDQFRKEFESGAGLSVEMKRIIADFNQEVAVAGNSSITGAVVGGYITTINKVQDAVDKVSEANANSAAKIAASEKLIGKIYGDQVVATESLIQKKRDELAIAKLMPESTKAEIIAKNSAIQAIEKEIQQLGELGKAKKEVDQIKSTEEALAAAVIKGDQKEIDNLGRKVALLKKERELRQWIAEEAVAFANGTVTQAQRDSIFYPKPITGKTEAGTQVGDTRTTNKILYEVVAIDKTGPVWKKVGLESDKLKKKIDQNAKEAAKEQKEIDDQTEKNKQKNREAAIYYAEKLTMEMIKQLDITEEEAKMLEGMASAVANLAKGDYIGAAVSYVTTLVTAIRSAQGMTAEEVNTNHLENINKSISQTNKLLDYQLNALNDLDGSDWFSSALKQVVVLNNQLNSTVGKLNEITVKTSDRGRTQIDTSKWSIEQWQRAILDPGFTFVDKSKDYAQQYLDQWLKLDDELKKIQDEQKSRLLGFQVADISTGLADGIIAGLKLAQNGLGEFAAGFGKLMEMYGSKALQTFLNEKYLNNFYEKAFELASDQDGLSDTDLSVLENMYEDAAKAGQEFYDGISKLFTYNKDATAGQKGLTGAIQGITEETGGMIAGYLLGVKTDIRTIIANMSRNDDDTVKKLSYLKEIAENTRHNSRLVQIESGISETNRILNEKLG